MSKRSLIYLVLLLIFGLIGAESPHINADLPIRTKQDIADFYYEICMKYFPDGIPILEYDSTLIHTSYTSGASAEEHMGNIGTVIHEAAHLYEQKVCHNNWHATGIYLGDNISIPVQRGKVYDTRILDSVFTENYDDKIFRYDPYIISKDGLEITAHVHGIYGLLEEMNAYYLGARASTSILPWYESRCKPTDFDCWAFGPLTGPSDDYLALHQFRVFIAWYLEYAQANEPEVFLDCMENIPLRVAFTLLEQKFEEAEARYFDVLDSYIQKLNTAGLDVRIEHGFLNLHEGTWTYGSGLHLDEAEYCKNLLKGDLELMLDQFRLRSVTVANYKEYLDS